jgi:site-specific DNA-methyltransferase (adenine-specific)
MRVTSPIVQQTDHRLYIPSLNIDLRLGDSLDILPTLDEKADAVISDPPYGIGYEGAKGGVHGDQSIEEATRGIPFMVDALKDDAFMCLFTRWDVEYEWLSRLTARGLTRRGQKIWVKHTSTLVGRGGPVQRNQHENVIITSKGLPSPHHWQDRVGITGEVGRIVKQDSSVFEHPVPPARDHSTPKPVDLCERLVRSYCPEDGLVLDPYMGTGPMALAAIRSGRGYVGIEKEQAHFAVAVARVVAELGLNAEFDNFALAA